MAKNDNMVNILMRTGGQDQDQIFETEIAKYGSLTQQIDMTIQHQLPLRDQIVVVTNVALFVIF